MSAGHSDTIPNHVSALMRGEIDAMNVSDHRVWGHHGQRLSDVLSLCCQRGRRHRFSGGLGDEMTDEAQ